MFPYKIIFTDLDLTLLRTGAVMSDYSSEVLNRALKQGVKVCFASARKPGAITPFMGNLIERLPLIAYNGAYIRSEKGEVIFSSCMDSQAIADIIQVIRQNRMPGSLMAYANDNWFVEDMTEEYVLREIDYARAIPLKADFDELLNNGTQFNKVMFLSSEAPAMEKLIVPKADPKKLHICLSASICLDIMNCGIHKGVGLDKVLDYYALKRDDAIAFGDNYNDVEMIQTAGFGVAMGNSDEFVKNSADACALTNNEDGVAKFLEGLGL